MDQFQFELGQEAQDTVTGFRGVITGRYEFLNGCIRYTLEAPAKDNDVKDFTFDEDRLEKVAEAPAPRDSVVRRTGGPRHKPPAVGL